MLTRLNRRREPSIASGQNAFPLASRRREAAAALTDVSWPEVTIVLEDACKDDDDPTLCLAFADAVEKGIGTKRDVGRAKTIREATCAKHRNLCD